MSRIPGPRSGLAALLDALEQELLGAEAGEVHDALRDNGRARAVACQEVRTVLNEAIAAGEEGVRLTPQPDICGRTGLYLH